jgi:hypothetical protein
VAVAVAVASGAVALHRAEGGTITAAALAGTAGVDIEMQADLNDFVSKAGALTAVVGVESSSGRFTSLQFAFEAGCLSLRCNADSDEIVVATGECDVDQGASEDDVLAELIGMTVEYAWSLTNHRGYVDALQLRFTDGEGHDETRQFEVAAGAMDIRRVVPASG